MAEMVTHEVNGLRFGPGDAGALARALHRLLDEPGLLPQLRAGIPRVRTIEEDAEWTRDVYRRCVASALADTETPDSAASARVGPHGREPAARDVVARRPPLPRVAAVVLNYRTPGDTILAVRALQASDRPVQDIVVVDNASADGSAAAFREHLAGVRLLETGENLGFSGGSNVGIRDVLGRGADLVLLINADVTLTPDCLGHLEAALTAEADAGIAGPVLVRRAEPDGVASAGMMFSPATGRMRHPEHGLPVESLTSRPATWIVSGVSGCAMLVRREILQRIGLLDEDYFFSFEDLDFCLRARRAGFSAVVARDAVAYHEGSASIGAQSARRLYFAARNHLLLAERALTPANGLGAWVRRLSIVSLNLARAGRGVEMPRVAGLRAVLAGVQDHRRGRYGAGP